MILSPSASKTRAPHFYVPSTTSTIVNVECGNLTGSFLNRHLYFSSTEQLLLIHMKEKGYYRPNPVAHITEVLKLFSYNFKRRLEVISSISLSSRCFGYLKLLYYQIHLEHSTVWKLTV